MDKLYTATATAVGGRTGTVKTDDGKLSFQLTTPKEMQGEGGEGTNPEQLFACGYSACFGSALQLIAKQQKVDADQAEVTAHVTLGKDAEGGFQLAARIDVRIPGMERERVQELADAAHQVCPYSKATRGNIEVEVRAVD
ncbi:organic hydroperoxide resistance protein [Paenibacillus sp. J31TS4]|uniref:organic hydroperoxide resistance protein n=1 Tax=Paenibacillus sp. J31TS4 TaxID=2807195 RepID=UPI001B2045C2|nr:organic hydroperoxide resistance protein [Paenibacillus sp. J31TS4]GIP38088.1 organic hydroperoxide resistance protein [Paenibacillus sp. J31TS4]